MNRPTKILASLALATGLVIPASAAQASSPATGAAGSTQRVATVDLTAAPAASGDVYGCPRGWVCMYTDAGFARHSPEHKYYRYGCYNLHNELGWRAIVNNQTGGATASGYRNYGCTSEAWEVPPSRVCGYKVDITPIDSISLNRP